MPVPKRSKSVRYHLKNINEDKSMDIDLFQTEYKMFIEELKEKGY